jgi:hypothetical protein
MYGTPFSRYYVANFSLYPACLIMSAIGSSADDPIIKYRIELWKQDGHACQSFEDLVLFLRHLARDQICSQSSCICLDLCVSRLEAFATVLNIHTPVPTNGVVHTIPNADLNTVWRGVDLVISVGNFPYLDHAQMLTKTIAKPEFS